MGRKIEVMIQRAPPRVRRELSHEEACYVHASRRLRERYGMRMSRALHADLVSRVQGGHRPMRGVCFLGRSSRTRTLWRVCVGGDELTLAYSSSIKGVVTFLPRGSRPWHVR